MTGKRGPVSGSSYGQKPGPEADPERQKLLGRPSHTAKRPTKPVAISHTTTIVPPPVPDGLGVVAAAIWNNVWQALPILSPKLDHHSVLRYCEASEDAVRARAEVEKRGLIIDEPMADPRGGILGYKAVLNPAEAAQRRADKVVTELGDRLGLTPASRARLGLIINSAALASAEASRLLDSMYAAEVIDIETKKW